MACHTVCEKYKNWKSEHEKRRADIVKRNKIDNEFISAKIEFSNNYYRKTKRRRK